MSTTAKSNPDQSQYLVFAQNHRPGLKSGDYALELTHQITGTGIDSENTTPAPITFHFSVRGDRFSLPPTHLHSVFPPAGSLGEYSQVLPHVIFNRNTLPWERFAMPPDQKGSMSEDDLEKIPWLALLVFNPDELQTVTDPGQTLSPDAMQHQAETGRAAPLSSLTGPAKGWSGIADTEYADPSEKIQVIYAKKSTLINLLPTTDELQYLAHTRHASDTAAGASVGNEMALVIANRLPQPNGPSIIHLVSVEDRYQPDKSFNFNGAGDDDLVTLVTLKSWRIACITPEQSFDRLLHNLDQGVPALPAVSGMPPAAQAFLEMGFLPEPHHFRRGGKSISWYHGPLAPGKYQKGLDTSVFPVHTADELLRYDDRHGLFDVSYAAAWELGRLLCLQQKKVSANLYQWKCQHAAQLLQAEQSLTSPHLPLTSRQHNGQEPPELPAEVDDWFSRISLLDGVPFNYLLPDERLLPKESIRFFELDPSWIAALVDGAFSIGRVIRQDKARDISLKAKLGDTYTEQGAVSGFILRSAVVAGWPGFLLEGYDTEPDQVHENQPISATPLPVLRMERIAPNILICLFQGELQVLDIHLKPEVLHFGVDEVLKSNPVQYDKKLRNADGTERSDSDTLTVPLTLNAQRKVDIAGLFNSIAAQKDKLGFSGAFASGQFALEMVEGVPKVRFMRG